MLKGFLGATSQDPVSYVNAPQIAEARGLTVDELSSAHSSDFVNLITLRSAEHSVSGTLTGVGIRVEPRIVAVDDHLVDVKPTKDLLVVRNDDRPGVIGAVGTALGNDEVSITRMAVGPSREGNTALMVLATDGPASDQLLEQVRALDGIIDVHRVSL